MDNARGETKVEVISEQVFFNKLCFLPHEDKLVTGDEDSCHFVLLLQNAFFFVKLRMILTNQRSISLAGKN